MPVRFMATVEAMYEQGGARIFLEIGPRRTLTGLVSQILGEREHQAMALDDGPRSGREQLAHVLAALHATGAPVNLDAWFVQDKGWARTTERPAEITWQ
jgi:acyl transferase domain-containing protein